MTFASPQSLFLFVIAVPLIWYVGWPRYAFRRRRDVASLLLRTLLVSLVILALSGLQIVRVVDRQAVVFLVDASDSMGAALQEAQVNFIQDALETKPPDDEWALVIFGADASIDAPLSSLSEVSPIRSTVLGSQTNIADALQTALSLFPADARRRIVILSDGRETLGTAESRARLAQASGVEISYVLFAREDAPDVRIRELIAPAQVSEGQEFDLSVTITSSQPTEGTLLIYSNGTLIRETGVALREGDTRYTLTQSSDEGGFLNFSAQIIVPTGSDSFSQNNQLGAFTQVVGPPRVLMVYNDPSETINLAAALESAGVTLDVVPARNMPQETAALAVYDSIILVNVPAAEFTLRQMERIQSYVRDLGGGLIFVGGPESYGPGGYYQTPIEETLPVETQIRDQQRVPRLTIAYLVDRSGSMGVAADGVFTNLQLAQRAVNLSIGFLQPTDRAAVGTFDSSGTWVAEFQDVNDTQRLQDLVNTLRPGGGTDIMAGLRLVERDIIREDSERKHLILITDGGSDPQGLVELVTELNLQAGVTTSVLALGTSQPPFLQEIAVAGQGNYHSIGNAAQIPFVLSQETVLATRSYIEEGRIEVRGTALNPMIDGLTQPPELRGYVATTERSTAQVVLRSPEPLADPLLATWQYGLGRSIAFTSDATGRWAAAWVNWGDFSRFWGQVVDYSITENADSNIESQVLLEGEEARIVVDARDDAGAFLNNLGLQASIVRPDGSSETVVLLQTEPGRYEGHFRPTDEGSYVLAINGTSLQQGEPQTFNEITGWVLSYSPEYADYSPNPALLQELAQITGGRDLADDPAGAFAITQAPQTAAAPVWPVLLLGAILLLPVDIAVRRLIITRSDIRRLRVALSGGDPNAAPDERISSLLLARQRAREKTGTGDVDMSAVDALRRTRDKRQQSASSRYRAQPPRNADGTETVSSLLKRRRTPDDDSDE